MISIDEQIADEIDEFELHRQIHCRVDPMMAALIAENEALRKGLDAVVALINESHGVSGLHLNGNIAPWEELRTGGRFDDWLSDFDAAIKEQS